MLLNNITAIEIGQKHVLGIESDAKFKHIVAESIFGMFCYFMKNACFDFVSNIIANLACQAEGRKFLIQNKYIEAIVKQMTTKEMSQHRRKYLMTCLRNLFFEFQLYQDIFLEMDVPKHICKVLIDEQGIVADLPDAWTSCKAKKAKLNELEIDYQNWCYLIEALALLSENMVLRRRMFELNVHSLLPCVKLPTGGDWEDTRTRSELLQLKLATIDDPVHGDGKAAEASDGQI